MANTKRHFIAGKMNKSVDERLLPNGEYVDALNVRLGSTEASEIGSVENSKGNTQLTTLEFNGTALSNNAKCIGVYEDGTRETIYWFVHDPSFSAGAINKLDLIVSLNVKDDILTYHVVSERDGTTSSTTLNFNPTYLITGIDMVEDFLFFTDDYNAPRVIDITRNYQEPSGGVDQFTEEDILVIKKPPLTAPTFTLSNTGGEENYIEQRFLCFAYRYRYENNQYSATSPFSKPAFAASPFLLDGASFLNEGMLNSQNNINLTYNSGGPLVKGIDILFKESNNSVIKVARKFDKETDGLADNTDYNFVFNSNQIFTILPDSELLRLFDNVPRFAKAQTVMGNRLMYGNYVEGYDLKDKNNNPLILDFDASLQADPISIKNLFPVLSSYDFSVDSSVANVTVPDSKITLDFTGIELKAGSTINISLDVEWYAFSSNTPIENSGTFPVTFSYTLNQDFDTIHDLATSTDFQEKIGTDLPSGTILPVYDGTNPSSCDGFTFTDIFNCNVPEVLDSTLATTWTKYVSGQTTPQTDSTTDGQGIIIGSSASSDNLELTIVAMRRVDDIANPNDPATQNAFEYFSIASANANLSSSPSSLSLHSNRNYEVGIIYMDDFGRATTALVSEDNSVNVPCGNSNLQNKIQVTIPPYQLAPSFATRYKFCIKPDLETYETIYSTLYFFNPATSYTYFLIDGENAQKVEVGDRYIVKKDSTGPLTSCRYATVLEKKAEEENFFTIPDTTIPAGVYMKILANDFSVELPDDAYILPGTLSTVEEMFLNPQWDRLQVYYGLGGGVPISAGTPPAAPTSGFGLTIPSGSTIRFTAEYTRVKIVGFELNISGIKINLEFTSPREYASIIEWFDDNGIEDALNNGKVIDKIGDGLPDPTFVRYPNSNIATPNTYGQFPSNILANPDEIGYLWYENTNPSSPYYKEIRWVTRGFIASSKSKIDTKWEIVRGGETVIFETQPSDALPDVWYESSESYAIDQSTGYHEGSDGVYQTSTTPAVVDTDFGNCYTFGNGAESYKIRDSIKGKAFDLGERFFSTSAEDYQEADRFASITYSGVFNAETNVNKLNEFNLGILNFKNLEESFGEIQILSGRETDILTLQEDKISYVLSGKNLLSDAAAGSAITSVPEVLGTQMARIEEYGISSNPESFVQYGYDKFFTDSKRGAVLQLRGQGQAEQLTVISELGMRSWFRDLFLGKNDTQKLGAFDPYMNEYVLSSNDTKLPVEEVVLNCGVKRRLTVSAATPVSFTVNVGNTVGVCDIDYDIISFSDPGSITIAEDYTSSSVSPSTTGAGTLAFAKDSVSDDDVVITLTPASSPPGGKQVVVLDITVGCPAAQEITLIEVCVSKDNNADKTIHNEYQWTDGSFTSALQSKKAIFPSGDRNLLTPEIAYYTTIVAPQGGSIIPNDGDTLTIRSIKKSGDTYDFDNSTPPANRLMFLRSNTLYGNNVTDIGLLLGAATPLTISSPATGTFEGTVTIPSSTDEYMYIIYDYFTS
jgi:hypothetical protein